MVSDLLQPLVLNVIISCPVGDVENKEDTVTALVEVAGDWAERLLAGCVPNLQLHVRLLTHDHSKVSKLHPDGHTLLLFEGLPSQSLQDASFAYSGLSYDNDFKKHVKVVHNTIEVWLVLDWDTCWKVVDLRVKVRV